ncbi:hypothetical protein TRVL_08745 [Trypanosoma vivax]|nr:hypothetical protein TRVL_08745 [Trypanosoma vivax]
MKGGDTDTEDEERGKEGRGRRTNALRAMRRTLEQGRTKAERMWQLTGPDLLALQKSRFGGTRQSPQWCKCEERPARPRGKWGEEAEGRERRTTRVARKKRDL